MKELFVKRVHAGEIIFKEGEKEAFMYHIVKGRVGIYSRYGKPNEKCLTEIGAEDDSPYFGEMGLLDGEPRSATAVALEDCELGEVREINLRFYLQQHPELVLSMLKRMSGRLRSLTEEYMDACRTIAEQEETKKPDAEWKKTVKKYAAILENPPTLAEMAAASRKHVSVDRRNLKNSGDIAVMEAKLVPAGTVIFDQGDVEDCMYDLMRGSVGIYADYGLPTEKKLTTLVAQKNRFFGEMGMLDAAPRSATAVAETDCQILTIGAQNMDRYFVDDPDALLAAMRQMSDRIRRMTKDYMEAVKTIAENEKCEQNGGNKPEWLTKNLKVFADIWKGMHASSAPKL